MSCVLCAVWRVLCAVCCVRCAVCCVVCAMCCVLCALCCVLCAMLRFFPLFNMNFNSFKESVRYAFLNILGHRLYGMGIQQDGREPNENRHEPLNWKRVNWFCEPSRMNWNKSRTLDRPNWGLTYVSTGTKTTDQDLSTSSTICGWFQRYPFSEPT